METKPILKSKTIWYSIILILLGVLQQATELLPAYVSQEYLGIALGIIGAVSLVLRFLTGQPLSARKPPAA